MRLSPEEIQKLQEAQKEFGSTALIHAFIDTHEVEGDRILTMMSRQGADRTFDVIFGIPQRSTRRPGAVTPPQPEPTGARVSDRMLSEPAGVPESKPGLYGLKAERPSIAVALPKDLERVMGPVGYTTAEQLATSVKQMATSRKLPAELLLAIIREESNFDPLARSKVGAVGLMQLMPDAAKQTGLSITKDKDERREPMRNIQAGLDYLAWLRDTYKIRTVEDLLGAYNAGPARLKDRKYQTIEETNRYIAKVKDTLASYRKKPEALNKDLQKLHNAVKTMALKKGDI